MRITEPYTIFKRKLPSGRYVYYYQYRDDYGRRSGAYSTGTDSLPQAKRIVRKLYNEGKLSTHSSVKFGNFAKGFFCKDGVYEKNLKLRSRKVSRSTLDIYDRSLQKLLLPFFAEMTLAKINTITVREYAKNALDLGNAVSSINGSIIALSVIMKNAMERQIISNVPKFETLPKQKKQRVLLSVDELKSFLDTAKSMKNKKSYLAMCLSICTGMRVGEVIGLKPENLYDDYVDIKHSYSMKYGLGPTKTKKNRYCPVPKELAEKLKEVSSENWIFDNGEKPITKEMLDYCFDSSLKNIGIDKKERGLTIHSLRGFFISHLREKNVPDAKIRAVVGHADPSMTDVYTYWKPDMFPEVNKVQQELYEKITGVQNERIC